MKSCFNHREINKESILENEHLVTDCNLSSVHRYNPATGKWVSVQPMRHRRAAFVLGSLGRNIMYLQIVKFTA